MLDEVSTRPQTVDQVESMLALASATLRRDSAGLINSRGYCAEKLVTLASAVHDVALRRRIFALFLLAWLRLGFVAECGPAQVSTNPDLPPGVVLPAGAAPEAISDPVVREEARQLVERHAEEVGRWVAKQMAIDYMYRLASLVRALRGDGREDEQELEAAMSLGPGLPPALRELLQSDAE
jgi:hypothetical protein